MNIIMRINASYFATDSDIIPWGPDGEDPSWMWLTYDHVLYECLIGWKI